MTSFGRAARNVEDLKKEIKDRTESALEDGMEDTASAVRKQLALNDSIATKELISSIRTRSRDNVAQQTPDTYAILQIVGAGYWKFVEFGTGVYTSRDYKSPGVPPYEPILEWVEEKPVVPDPDGPYETQEKLARAIQFQIEEQGGTEVHRFVRPAWRGPRGKDHVISKVGDALDTAVDNF